MMGRLEPVGLLLMAMMMASATYAENDMCSKNKLTVQGHCDEEACCGENMACEATVVDKCKVLPGFSCDNDDDCVKEAVCHSGVCKTVVKLGESCAAEHTHCDQRLVCDRDDHICKMEVHHGGDCSECFKACADHLICDKRDNFCKAPMSVGESCGGTNAFCNDGLICDKRDDICKEIKQMGEKCDDSLTHCDHHLTCDETQVCKIQLGHHCSGDQCEAGTVCDDGACKVPVGGECSGEHCETRAICDKGICKVPVGGECENGQCESDSFCEKGTCHVRLDYACSGCLCEEGALCDNGTCRVAIGNECGPERTCQAGATCVDGTCCCPRIEGTPIAILDSCNLTSHEHWSMTVDEQHLLRVDFKYLSLHVGGLCTAGKSALASVCPFDFIDLFDGISPHKIICGMGCPETYLTKGHFLSVHIEMEHDGDSCKRFLVEIRKISFP